MMEFKFFKSLPKTETIIDVGAADDFKVLHEAHANAYSILIDPIYVRKYL